MILVLIGFWLLVWTLLGGYVSGQKGRGGEGLVLGFLFGPFGVLIAAMLPTARPTKSAASGGAADFVGSSKDVALFSVVIVSFLVMWALSSS